MLSANECYLLSYVLFTMIVTDRLVINNRLVRNNSFLYALLLQFAYIIVLLYFYNICDDHLHLSVLCECYVYVHLPGHVMYKQVRIYGTTTLSHGDADDAMIYRRIWFLMVAFMAYTLVRQKFLVHADDLRDHITAMYQCYLNIIKPNWT